jgi:hypothetical protein
MSAFPPDTFDRRCCGAWAGIAIGGSERLLWGRTSSFRGGGEVRNKVGSGHSQRLLPKQALYQAEPRPDTRVCLTFPAT